MPSSNGNGLCNSFSSAIISHVSQSKRVYFIKKILQNIYGPILMIRYSIGSYIYVDQINKSSKMPSLCSLVERVQAAEFFYKG